jgi:hypothetical protein
MIVLLSDRGRLTWTDAAALDRTFGGALVAARWK